MVPNGELEQLVEELQGIVIRHPTSVHVPTLLRAAQILQVVASEQRRQECGGCACMQSIATQILNIPSQRSDDEECQRG